MGFQQTLITIFTDVWLSSFQAGELYLIYQYQYQYQYQDNEQNTTMTNVQPHSLSIVRVKYQRSDLDALPRRCVLWHRGIYKGRVRHSPRPPVRLAVEALDEQNLVRREVGSVEPAVGWAMAHGKCLAAAVRIDEWTYNEVVIGHGAGVGYGEGITLHRLDGPPDVDDLHAAL